MKIGIVGAGMVGSTTAFALVLSGTGDQIVLVDVNLSRAESQVLDIQASVPLTHTQNVISGGYSELSGAAVVVLAAGKDQNPMRERSELLEENAIILRQVVKKVLEFAPEAVLLVATQPVDPMVDLVTSLVPASHRNRVMGLGTVLDTSRLRAAVALRAKVDPRDVQAHVIGESGVSEVIVWSQATIGGVALDVYFAQHELEWSAAVRTQIADEVRRASVHIVQSKGATAFGVGAALARVIDAVVNDRKTLLTVSAQGLDGAVAISMPRTVGRSGVLSTLKLELDATEAALLEASVEDLMEA